MNINFTIIIPHKDTPNLLDRCLKSIPQRDDIQIIISDDNSATDIRKTCEYLALNKRAIKIINSQASKGAGHARNMALPFIEGKWVLFVDADDFFNSEIDDFFNKYIDSDCDIVYFNAYSLDSDTYEPSKRADHLNVMIDKATNDVTKDEGLKELRFLFSEPWAKMIKTSLIHKNKITFEETIILNDVRFSYNIGYHATKIDVDNRKLYCITTRSNSVSTNRTETAILTRFYVIMEWQLFLNKHSIGIESQWYKYLSYLFAIHLYKDFKTFKKEYRIIKQVGYRRIDILNIIIKNLILQTKYKLNHK